MKEYNVIYIFSEVCDCIKANSPEEAKEIAEARLLGDYNPQNDTECYKIEVEEVEQ